MKKYEFLCTLLKIMYFLHIFKTTTKETEFRQQYSISVRLLVVPVEMFMCTFHKKTSILISIQFLLCCKGHYEIEEQFKSL